MNREPKRGESNFALYGDKGVARYHTLQACSHVCPKEIDIARFLALANEG
jgi:succinate dehydrogenase / fumarate reductase iron-sulfur subunit